MRDAQSCVVLQANKDRKGDINKKEKDQRGHEK